MASIQDALSSAADEGIITAAQMERLVPFLIEKGAIARGSEPVVDASLNDAALAEESEQPRFVRGFHDILITIGIVVALLGLWGLGSLFAVLPAIVVLAEILIRRQRLALPAVALTVALIQWTFVVAVFVGDNFPGDLDRYVEGLFTLPIFVLVLAAFYWRYRVPLALAATLLSLFVLAMDLVFVLLTKATGSVDILVEHTALSATVFLLAALGVFSAAMSYDIADPGRKTRLSDVAFWLHLAAAPALLYAMLSFIFLRNVSGDWWGDATSPGDAVAVLAIVIVFMIVGLVIDRRAFVTSGLLSLGLAIWTILQRGGVAFTDYFSVTVLAVGVVVLLIGVFWQALRRAIVSALPAAVTSRLHPISAAAR
ncbi:hypothetical protein OIU34_05320 [Pararhizobium sp. BT-229]|uniref:hypothetical protein n=1 Tax=Pararhizobium sp. BT-229 TaxID=2986923 RepID=UPI0021F720E6|nr:hypothetical protein [Pararhizobium sp. BT-229]MCV9961314.1 hypothetical protein [Pararhizobium sp. BT-229]